MITSTSKNIWARGLSLRLLLNWNGRQAFHISSVYAKRPGPVSDPKLHELIIDKPPNFYPTLRQKLDRINYYDDVLNEVDIGYGQDSQCVANFMKSNDNIRENLKFSDEADEDELLDFDEKSSATLTTEEYQRLAGLHSFTKEHINSTIALAHHYAIYRDLFFRAPVLLQTDNPLIVANAKNEAKYDPKSQQPSIFSFLPLVPIDAEFHFENGEDVLCQKSHRGNLIPPEYGANAPKVIINTAAINGQSSKPEDLSISKESNTLISINSGKTTDSKYYTLALINLDSHFSDSGVCHWLVTNIHSSSAETTAAETVVKYLPVYGIRGLGYHRYAFVLFAHNKPLTSLDKIDDFDLAKRKFNGLRFMDTFAAKDKDLELKPVGLSWFQTTWNENCRDVFYNYLGMMSSVIICYYPNTNKFFFADMRSPTYEYIYPTQVSQFNQLQFPARAPFNL